uniref:Uncharacterized protein n=1 Tax=Anguilla anguilla TaxID=7936 RepID=A0A0E9XPN5_ANGAN
MIALPYRSKEDCIIFNIAHDLPKLLYYSLKKSQLILAKSTCSHVLKMNLGKIKPCF